MKKFPQAIIVEDFNLTSPVGLIARIATIFTLIAVIKQGVFSQCVLWPTYVLVVTLGVVDVWSATKFARVNSMLMLVV